MQTLVAAFYQVQEVCSLFRLNHEKFASGSQEPTLRHRLCGACSCDVMVAVSLAQAGDKVVFVYGEGRM